MAKNILICDDAAFMRMMIKDILTKNGYNIPVMETFMSKFSRYLRRFYKAVSFLFIPHYVRNPKSDH